MWDNDSGYNYYNFNEPEKFDERLFHTFDAVVIDPPFITRDVWELYSTTAKTLLKFNPCKSNDTDGCRGIVIATTVAENENLMHELFQAKPTIYKPNIPNLVYQYKVFTNFIDECSIYGKKNPELMDLNVI